MVSYYGGRCLLVEERERGADVKQVLILPSTKTSRARTLEKKSQVVIDVDSVKKLSGDGFLINGPGEYDVSGFAIRGITVGAARVYVIDVKQMTLGYVTGNPAEELDEKALEAIGMVDVLAVPLPFTEDTKQPLLGLGALVRAVEPSVVIPMTEDKKLIKAIGIELGTEATATAKLNVTRKDLVDEGFVINALEVQ